MSARKRRFVLGLLLVLTLCAVASVSGDRNGAQDDVAATVSDKATRSRKDPTSKHKPQDAEQESLALDKLQRSTVAAGEANPFGVKSWYVPPPLPPLPPPSKPLPPTVPPLPFVYIGKMEQGDGQWMVYLVKGGQFFAVTKGETFDDVYRMDGIENGNLLIQYLPLSIRQHLPNGSEP